MTLAETKATRGDISVTVELASELPTIEGDAHQLCQVFTNLLTNAFEALDGHGSVSITATVGLMDAAFAQEARAPIPTVVIEIADTARDVPGELTDKHLQSFFTTKPQGSGLGLAIVRRFVDAHDGRIDVSNNPDGVRVSELRCQSTSASGWFK